MKQCKSCKVEIAADAKKCSHCQSFQYWYSNPMWRVWGILLLFWIGSTFWIQNFSFGRNHLKFEDYQSQIHFKLLSQDTIIGKNGRRLNLLIELQNESEGVWKRPNFSIKFLDENGKLLNVEQGGSYQFILPAKDTITTSVKVPFYEEYKGARIELELVEMDNRNY